MKRSEVLKLIAKKVSLFVEYTEGFNYDFIDEHIDNADVILTALESLGIIQPPIVKIKKLTALGFEYSEINAWEPE